MSKQKFVALFIACAVLAVASGCGHADKSETSSTAKPIDQPMTTASGLQYTDVVVGTGATAVSGSHVSVQYTGWLTTGEKFDSSYDRGTEPFSFSLGQGQVIRGWDEGVAGMKVGGKRRLQIPPDLAYGASGAGGVIPPDATLIFDVELVGVSK